MELAPKSPLQFRKLLPWMGLFCVLAGFPFAVAKLHPTNYFGYTEDDSVYFSSAKALAQGKGYVLESFPGAPAATKYPIFYPWLLSWVWRLNPSFPANLVDAIAINVAFGMIFIAAAFLFVRRFKGVSDFEALILAAFCAFHPIVLFYSGSVLSDIPFAAIALATMLLAENAIENPMGNGAAVACGILAGISVLTRGFGVPVAVGILVACAVRRAWRPLLIAGLAIAPFFAFLCWHTVFPNVPASPASGPAASSLGWTHTWAYYTSYVADWRQGVPNAKIFLSMLKAHFELLITTPAWYFVHIPPDDSPLVPPLTVTVGVACVAGLLRQRKLRPVYLVFGLYSVLVVLWNYGQAVRFLVPFLPLFTAGIWLECKHLARMIRKTLTKAQPVLEIGIATALAAVAVLFACAVVQNYVGGIRTFTFQLSRDRAVLLKEKRGAYDWISHSSDPQARIVAYEDAALFLYTGRSASRPFTFPTVDFYERGKLQGDVEHIMDVARAIQADYLVSSADDYDMEWSEAYRRSHAQMAKLERLLPLEYRSERNHVRVYSLACLQDPASERCDAAMRSAVTPVSGNPTLTQFQQTASR